MSVDLDAIEAKLKRDHAWAESRSRYEGDVELDAQERLDECTVGLAMVAEIRRLRTVCEDSAFHATNYLSLATGISYQPGEEGMADLLPDIRANRDTLLAASKGGES